MYLCITSCMFDILAAISSECKLRENVNRLCGMYVVHSPLDFVAAFRLHKFNGSQP